MCDRGSGTIFVGRRRALGVKMSHQKKHLYIIYIFIYNATQKRVAFLKRRRAKK